jgi:hypothetical protein
VMRDVPDKGVVLGIPALPDKQMKRSWIGLQQLPETTKRLRELERQVAELKAVLSSGSVGDGGRVSGAVSVEG